MQFTAVTLIASFMLGLLSLPLVAHAQRTDKKWRLGVLTTLPRPVPGKPNDVYTAFLLELRNLGYVEGQNLIIEWRETAGSMERRRREVAALIALKPDVVVGVTAADAVVLREAGPNVPIVLAGAGSDLVAAGLVASLARPGGNITGIQTLQSETAPKRLHILKELMPPLQCVAVLRETPAAGRPIAARDYLRLLAELDASSRTLAVRIRDVPVGSGDDFDRVFAEMKRGCDVALVDSSPFLTAQRPQLLALASRHGLPTMHDFGAWVEAGGLVSYGPNLSANWRRTAHFVDRIFKGEKPADIPLEQPRNFELFINLKTAKALNLKIPKHLMLLADRVIE